MPEGTWRARMLERPLLPAALVALAGALAYGNIFQGAFHFDDPEYIVNNEAIRNFSTVGNVRFARHRKAWWYSNALCYWIGRKTGTVQENGQPMTIPFHAYNLALHIGSAILLLLLLWRADRFRRRMGWAPRDDWKGRAIAFLAAAMFAAHPLTTESVTYICGRDNGQGGFFYLLGLLAVASWIEKWFYRRYMGRRFTPWQWVWPVVTAAAASALAMLTKEVYVTFPAAAVLLFLALMNGRNEAAVGAAGATAGGTAGGILGGAPGGEAAPDPSGGSGRSGAGGADVESLSPSSRGAQSMPSSPPALSGYLRAGSEGPAGSAAGVHPMAGGGAIMPTAAARGAPGVRLVSLLGGLLILAALAMAAASFRQGADLPPQTSPGAGDAVAGLFADTPTPSGWKSRDWLDLAGAAAVATFVLSKARRLPRPLSWRVPRWIAACILLAGTVAALLAFVPFARHAIVAGLTERPKNPLRGLRSQAVAVPIMFLKSVAPWRPNLDPDFPVIWEWRDWRFACGVAALAFICSAAFLARRRAPYFAFAVGLYLVTVAPSNSFIERGDIVSERNFYLAAAAGAIVGAWLLISALAWIVRRLGELPAWRPAWILGATVAAVSPMAALTHVRNREYSDRYLLWKATVECSPFKIRPLHNLGIAAFHRNRIDEAVWAFSRAMEIGETRPYSPDDVIAERAFRQSYINMFGILVTRGRLREAEALIGKAAGKFPDDPDVMRVRAEFLIQKGDLMKCYRELKAHLYMHPHSYNAYYLLG
ncbi:MAG: hypothetical protein N3A38_12890, partial [Planctomycetota bacterium]|nr:hypothetical protein [Planctomycetota bacterium]